VFKVAMPAGPATLTVSSTSGVSQKIELPGTDAVCPERVDLAPGGVVFSGRVETGGEPAEGAIEIVPKRASGVAPYMAPVDPSGRFAIRLATGDYRVTVRLPGYWETEENLQLEASSERLLVTRPLRRLSAPAPAAFTDWVRRHASPVRTTATATDTSDLAPLDVVARSVRIVGLGEATHGSKELFDLKARIIERLVTHRGFRTIGFEANAPEVAELNRYVIEQRGNPEEILSGLHFWTCNTEEVLALIEWVRQFNATRPHSEKVRFFGIDSQYPERIASSVLAHLEKYAPRERRRAMKALAPLLAPGAKDSYQELSATQQTRVQEEIERLQRRVQRGLLAKAPTHALRAARRDLTLLIQSEFLARNYNTRGYEARDRFMADNVGALLEEGKVVVWAHNAHIGRHPFRGMKTLGSVLGERFGGDYLAIGTAFYEGSFQARDAQYGKGIASNRLTSFDAGRARCGSLEAALGASLPGNFLLDLRAVPAEVARWLEEPRLTRYGLSAFTSRDQTWFLVRPANHYDIVAFVRSVRRAVPTRMQIAREEGT
jgi:erythromycin esterase